ncbi:MAG: hypothetical protein J6Y60_11365 [Treponema sp.]|nr:hypothetical protein [Treponema sp.]
MKYINAVTYEGDFKDGMYDGKGILKDPSGNCYTGEFKNNARNGKGIQIYSTGDRAEGKSVYDV